MTLSIENLTSRFEQVFTPRQAETLAVVIHDVSEGVAKSSDFTELKAVVQQLAQAQRDLAQAQGRTEARMDELVQAQRDLAQAQGRTEARMEELAQAQRDLAQAQGRTEARMEELAQAQGRTEREVRQLAQELGGLSRSASYALENEAYRQLPAYLAAHHGIHLTERMVRTDVGGEEINLFALGERDGAPIVIVGETKLQLDRRRGTRDALERLLDQLEAKAKVVQAAHPEREVVRLLVTHYIRPSLREVATRRNVLIAQSFEW
jgi:plasmid maintenance system antidote protein VapI